MMWLTSFQLVLLHKGYRHALPLITEQCSVITHHWLLGYIRFRTALSDNSLADLKFTLKFKDTSNRTTQYNRNFLCTLFASKLEIAKNTQK